MNNKEHIIQLHNDTNKEKDAKKASEALPEADVAEAEKLFDTNKYNFQQIIDSYKNTKTNNEAMLIYNYITNIKNIKKNILYINKIFNKIKDNSKDDILQKIISKILNQMSDIPEINDYVNL